MSSTNRGYDRHQADYYVTPQKPIKEFLSLFLVDEGINRPDRMQWLDPCAGGSQYDEMSYVTVISKELSEDIDSIDIREDSKANFKANYLTNEMLGYNVIITNPPFYIALEIIKKALSEVEDGGYVIMLLRLNFFGSDKRRNFFDVNMPKYCYVHSNRINFIPKWLQEKIIAEGGKKLSGDSIEYAHYVWQKGYTEKYTKLKLI